ncbi:transcriptional regulator [Flavobacterium sp.]|uniref:transcriptional regulator n=1 Tax=Flavobacterium sp. TaxID=239 RepID=UPI00391AD0C9
MGYIKYEPSYNPFRGSHVIMFNFAEDLKPQPKTSSKNEPFLELVTEQVLNKHETSTEQALVSSLNNINITNKKNESKHTPSNSIKNDDSICNSDEVLKKEKSSDKKEKERIVDFVIPVYTEQSQSKDEMSSSINFQKPQLDEIFNYFILQEFERTEAQKFFNYYESNGWLIGGKTTMANWQAAAQNWMSKTKIFNQKPNLIVTHKPNHLNTTINKNYAEPL